MKVLFISTADYKYGAAKTQIDMIMELKNTYGIVPIVLTKKHNAFNALCDEQGIENYSYWYRDIMAGSAYSSPILNVAKHIVKYLLYLRGALTQSGIMHCGIKWDEIAIIHSNHIRIDIGAYISRRTGIPHVWHIKELNQGHVRIVHYKPYCYRYINRNADRFIAVTKQVREYWCRAGLDKRKMEVIYEGVDIDKFNFRKKRRDDQLRLVCVGRIEKSKGQLQILQAMVKLPEEVRQNVTLDLIGEPYPDYFRQLQSYIKKNAMEDKVRFLGYQDNIPELLAGYDAGILSSRGDAFGTVVAEYMAAGLLVIATYTELAEHKKTGLRYKFGDIEKLAENIRYVYENRKEADRIAEAGAAAIRGHYSIETNAAEVYKLYQNMVS
jgi:glycosyltransferase involved in cell wall biosynthesis